MAEKDSRPRARRNTPRPSFLRACHPTYSTLRALPPMFLGIEIGGTKLQLGVGPGQGPPLIALERQAVDPDAGAEAILEQIRETAPPLIARHGVTAVGFGFGGPVDMAAGRAVKSHQVAGWDDFCLSSWCQKTLQRPAVVGNDCDVAALAEARFGAGRGRDPVFYVTVGTGVGGGLVIAGRIYRGSGAGAAEIGHLRLVHGDQHWPLESACSGPGIDAAATAELLKRSAADADANDLRRRVFARSRQADLQDGRRGCRRRKRPGATRVPGGRANAGLGRGPGDYAHRAGRCRGRRRSLSGGRRTVLCAAAAGRRGVRVSSFPRDLYDRASRVGRGERRARRRWHWRRKRYRQATPR